MDQLDSLEEWVAIRDQPFTEKCIQKFKLVFEVRWDEAAGKLAVKCQRLGSAQPAADSTTTRSEWAGMFTLGELCGIHQQLSLVHPSLGQYLPRLPSEPRGLWAYITHAEPVDALVCDNLLQYFRAAADICGEQNRGFF
jgi:hypothetical protein